MFLCYLTLIINWQKHTASLLLVCFFNFNVIIFIVGSIGKGGKDDENTFIFF